MCLFSVINSPKPKDYEYLSEKMQQILTLQSLEPDTETINFVTPCAVHQGEQTYI